MLSARTISPKCVSPPSLVRWPPRSRTLRQPSQSRSRLRGNRGELLAVQGLRRGGIAGHAPQLAGLCRAGEVHRGVAPRAAAQERLVGPRRALDEHFLDAADALAIPLARDTLHALDEPLDPVALRLLRDLVPR